MEAYLEEINRIKNGVAMTEALQLMKKTGMTQKKLASLIGLSISTFAERKKAGTLNQIESERILRLEKAFALATTVFDGNPDAAKGWLISPLREFDHNTALDMLETDVGAAEVMNLLNCIEHGVYS